LLQRISGAKSYPKVIAVEPELVVRESTGAPLLPDLMTETHEVRSARNQE